MLTVISPFVYFPSPEEIVAGGGVAGSAPVEVWSKGELPGICISAVCLLKIILPNITAFDYHL